MAVDRPLCLIFTARKRSLRQGNIFAPVCHSVHGGVWSRGVPGQGGAWSRGVPGGDPHLGWLLLWVVRILLECILVKM